MIGSAAHHWPSLLEELLGVVLPADDGDKYMRGSSMKVKWLREQFGVLADDATEHTVQCNARAYILMLMHGVLFPYTSGSMVQLIYLPLLANLETVGRYNWASATLAYFYKQLCRATKKKKVDIVGPAILLQVISK